LENLKITIYHGKVWFGYIQNRIGLENVKITTSHGRFWAWIFRTGLVWKMLRLQHLMESFELGYIFRTGLVWKILRLRYLMERFGLVYIQNRFGLEDVVKITTSHGKVSLRYI
jgi:hypothetical protein